MLVSQGFSVRGIFVDYGQAARSAEALAVSRIAEHMAIATTTLSVGTGAPFGPGELVGRNAFLLMSAIFLGQVHFGVLAIGIHAGTPYFDCSPSFFDRMRILVEEHTAGRLTLAAPFLTWDKGQIHAYAVASGIPIAATYSCESGTIPPCGSCASCRDRRSLGC